MKRQLDDVIKYALVSFLLAAGSWNFFNSERIDLFDGYGTDGIMFGGRYFINIEERLRTGDGPDAMYSRFLPMLLVKSGMKMLGAEIEPEQKYSLGAGNFTSQKVLKAYNEYNFIIYVLIVAALLFLCKAAGLTSIQTSACLILVMINFCNLKRFFLEPVSLDPTIMLHGIAMLGFYFRKNVLPLAVTAIAGFAINDLNESAGILLCTFAAVPMQLGNRNKKIITGLSALAGLLVGLIAVFTYFNPLCPDPLESPPIRQLLPISVLLIVLFITLSIYFLLRNVDLKSLVTLRSVAIQWMPLIVVLFIYIGYRLFAKFMATEERIVCQSANAVNHLITGIVYGSIRPLGNIVSFTIYFGASLLFVMLFYKRFSLRINEMGIAVWLLTLLAIPLFLNTNSRQLIFYSVLFPVVLCSAVNFKYFHLAVLFAINLLLSKFWINVNPLGTDLLLKAINDHDRTIIHSLPLQRYFMNFGTWMSNENYFIWLAITAAVMLLLFAAFKGRKARGRANAQY